jgi:hypothetical protein
VKGATAESIGQIALILQSHRDRLERRVEFEVLGLLPRQIPFGHCVRDTVDGRARIARALARLELLGRAGAR